MYDVYKIRKDFPMLDGKKMMQGKPLVYLDNASTTFKPQCVIDAISDYYSNCTCNSHRGDYDLAYNMDLKVSNCRKTIAKLVNCNENEVVFTSGTTMSINTIAYGLENVYVTEGDEIVLDETSHASNLLPWFKLAERTGAIIKYVKLNEFGYVSPANLKQIISNKTKVVALAWVSNVLGYTLDIKELSKIVHSVGALFVVDGAQAVPHIKIDFADNDIDLLTFSGHKMCGPTGIGCIIGKYDFLDKMNSFIVGGGMNGKIVKNSFTLFNPPMKFEAGTLNLAGIVGLDAAAKYLMDLGLDNIHQHDVMLHEYAIEKLQNAEKVIIYNKDAKGGILTFNIKDVFAQDEASLLNSKGIAVRSGEHCAKLMKDYLHTYATCRMSTYLYTTKEEIDIFVDALINGGDILDAFFN